MLGTMLIYEKYYEMLTVNLYSKKEKRFYNRNDC